MNKLTNAFVKACLQESDNDNSKLTDFERNLSGDTSSKLRCFINNVCSKDNTSYLEIGIYRGSTVIAAGYGNPSIKITAVDNWSYDRAEPKKWAPDEKGWPNVRSGFYDVIQKYDDPTKPWAKAENIKVLEQDFKDVDWLKQPKHNVVFLDVLPITEEVYDAFFTKVINAMTPNFVAIFSGYSNEKHCVLLDESFKKYSDLVEIEWKEQRISSSTSDSFNYHSGICIVGFKKKLKRVEVKND